MGTGYLRNGNNMLGRVQRRLDMQHSKEVERVFSSNQKKTEAFNKELTKREGMKKEKNFEFEPLNEPILEPYPKKRNSRMILSY